MMMLYDIKISSERPWIIIKGAKETNRFIGNIEFFNCSADEAEWGIVMTAKIQNKGYGKEALKRSVEYGFNDLGLNRIYLIVYADNPRAK
ncbi:MAG: GNAT family N-acetyltransferase [Clostridiales bacterium]|nr:GNAT family N-acetyltransferase [Clostridiales bacterium]